MGLFVVVHGSFVRSFFVLFVGWLVVFLLIENVVFLERRWGGEGSDGGCGGGSGGSCCFFGVRQVFGVF